MFFFVFFLFAMVVAEPEGCILQAGSSNPKTQVASAHRVSVVAFYWRSLARAFRSSWEPRAAGGRFAAKLRLVLLEEPPGAGDLTISPDFGGQMQRGKTEEGAVFVEGNYSVVWFVVSVGAYSVISGVGTGLFLWFEATNTGNQPFWADRILSKGDTNMDNPFCGLQGFSLIFVWLN